MQRWGRTHAEGEIGFRLMLIVVLVVWSNELLSNAACRGTEAMPPRGSRRQHINDEYTEESDNSSYKRRRKEPLHQENDSGSEMPTTHFGTTSECVFMV